VPTAALTAWARFALPTLRRVKFAGTRSNSPQSLPDNKSFCITTLPLRPAITYAAPQGWQRSIQITGTEVPAHYDQQSLLLLLGALPRRTPVHRATE